MIEAGYVVYNAADSSNRFKFDRSTGGRGGNAINRAHEDSRVELKTFGRVPYVYYAGEANYAKFSLSGVFHYDDETGETARQQVDRFTELINTRQVLTVKNSQGQEFLCDVNITGESAPNLYVAKDMDYIELTIECTQIDF